MVTGADGFVGGHLLPALRRRFPDSELAAATFDVADPDSARGAVAAARPEALVHLAAIAAPTEARSAPDLAWRVNLHGTLNLARAVLAECPGCLMLFASSADAYGESFRSGRPLDEEAALMPLGTYGATKAAADLALGAMAADGLRSVRARPFNHIGPGQSPAFAVAAFARQVARIEAGLQPPVVEVGSIGTMRDFLDVRDVCSAYAAILERRDSLAAGQVLNIASGRARRLGDVLDQLLRAAGVDAEVRTDQARLRPAEIAVSAGDSSLARRLLGWAPAIPWEQTLADVLADWRRRVAAGEEPVLQHPGSSRPAGGGLDPETSSG